MKNPLTLAGIEPATLRFVTQHLNHCATAASLRAGRSGDRIPVRGEIFCTRPDRPWAHTTSYTMGNRSFPGVPRPGRGIDHPPHLASRLKKE